MGLLFHFNKKMPESAHADVRDPSKTAPSFFTVSHRLIRRGCNGYGHGIVYEGRWVLYKGMPMKGQSKLNLEEGIEFDLLCRNDVFVSWFKSHERRISDL